MIHEFARKGRDDFFEQVVTVGNDVVDKCRESQTDQCTRDVIVMKIITM